ncbi:MAG: GGDEF domain-containing protein, partial [Actinomycetota bacterium]
MRASEVWRLKEPLRSYVVGVTVVALAAVAVSALGTQWQVRQLIVFVALLACGAIAIEATRGVPEPQGTVSRDLQSVWYLTIAVALPPVYAFAAPIPLVIYKLSRTRRMIVYRRVFSNATISLAYGCAALLFRSAPRSVAGPLPQAGTHVLTWAGLVAACGVLGWLINHGLLLAAVKISDPTTRAREVLGSRESVSSDLLELSLAVSLALLVAVNPVLMVLALPSVVLCRRYFMHLQLVAQSRIDTKTGLLNTATWQREAAAELYRALHSGTPLALAVVNIDQFKVVSESAGRDVGDRLIHDVAIILKGQLRDQDVAGRFGGEEFVILLPGTGADEARRISERLRDHIASESIAIETGAHADFVFRLTVSIGIAVLNQSRRALGELLGAADAALGLARSTGYSKVCVLPD